MERGELVYFGYLLMMIIINVDYGVPEKRELGRVSDVCSIINKSPRWRTGPGRRSGKASKRNLSLHNWNFQPMYLPLLCGLFPKLINCFLLDFVTFGVGSLGQEGKGTTTEFQDWFSSRYFPV